MVESPEVQSVAVVFGVVVTGLGGYGVVRGRVSRAEFAFMLVGAAALLAYGVSGAAAVLSLPQFVSDLLAGVSGLAFIGLFLYWAYNHQSETGD
ncbi:hypothetical protein [Halostella salina]|uniref:hypothetical protein n=1 Tax=Halostella salina TaxID=1547897 RepID=UPI000EF7C53E|nr:hypothetical protein [Halostella salina]